MGSQIYLFDYIGTICHPCQRDKGKSTALETHYAEGHWPEGIIGGPWVDKADQGQHNVACGWYIFPFLRAGMAY